MVIHWPTGRGPLVNNSPARMATSAASSEEDQATVAELAVAMVLVIAAMPGAEVEPQIAAEAGSEIVLPVAVRLA